MIAFRAAASAQNATGGDVVVTKPTGTAEGDILLVITLRPDAGTWKPVVMPSIQSSVAGS